MESNETNEQIIETNLEEETKIDEEPKVEETQPLEEQVEPIDEKVITETQVQSQIEDIPTQVLEQPEAEQIILSSNELKQDEEDSKMEQQIEQQIILQQQQPIEMQTVELEAKPVEEEASSNTQENLQSQNEIDLNHDLINESATEVVETILSNIVNETSNLVEQLNEDKSSILPPPPPMPLNEMIRMDESRDSQAETIDSSNEDDDNENSAVNAVLAAVEQAHAEKATTSADATVKIVKKKQKISTPNKNNSHTSTNENLNSSPLSAQKRRKKDPLAPKAPLNGYLVYFNEERADMRQKNPQMSFGELTKIIALKWKDLPAEDKQKYINEAELDKERYVKEMADYKKSDSYKQYLKETSNAKMARNEEMQQHNLNTHHNAHHNIKNEKIDPNLMNNSFQANQGININSLQHEVNVAGFDIPIFTEEFIEHSKNREHEMRQIRKEINELEQQNNVLYKHIDNMKQSTAKVESDIEKYQVANDKLSKNLDIFRQTILNCFSNLPLPNSQEYPSPANIDDYILKLYSILANSPQNDSFKMHVKSTLSKINFTSLFDSI